MADQPLTRPELDGSTVLIVDDTPGNLEVVENYLRGYGLTTFVATSGEAALKRINYNLPDLVLMDVMMPGIDGFETCRIIKADERIRDIPVIFMTALTDPEHKVKGFSSGGVDYITKPVNKGELLARVSTHLKMHRYQETLEQLVQKRTLELENRMQILEKEISERQRAEKALKNARNYILDIINSMPSMLIGVDLDGRITHWNNTAEQVTGLDAQTVLTKPLADVVPWLGLESDRVFRSIQTGKIEQDQRRARQKGGQTIFEEITIYPLIIDNADGAVIRVDDVTEKVALENKVAQSKKKYHDLMGSLVKSTVPHTGQDLFDAIVKNLEQIFKCDYAFLGQLKDGQTIEILSLEHRGKISRGRTYSLQGTPSETIIKQGNCIYRENVQNFFPEDAQLAGMDAQGYVGIQLKGENSRVLGVLCAVSTNPLELPEWARNIMEILQERASAEIERIRAFDEKALLETQLQQAQKMEAIGTLAGGIAHDFNNILGIILGFSEMLKRELEKKGISAEKLGKIMTAGERAKDLVGQILAFSRQSKKQLMPIRPDLIIKEVLKMLRASIPTTIKIRQNIPRCDFILADPTQFHQIVMNLCTNAYHAMREKGGTLAVTLASVTIEKNDIKALSMEVAPGPFVKLEISDTGHGIEKTIQQKIFDPYFTTKKRGEGSGLGLSVVHGYVKHFNGHICVYSEPGHGASFHIYLPRIHSVETSPGDEQKEAIPTGEGHILVVDDESFIVDMEREMLHTLGYRVTGCNSSPEALNKFRAQPGEFDLIITDMTMPDMTGVDLIQAVRSIRPDIPVILCTGYSELITRAHAEDMGINAYLMKPVLNLDLALAVKKVLTGV